MRITSGQAWAWTLVFAAGALGAEPSDRTKPGSPDVAARIEAMEAELAQLKASVENASSASVGLNEPNSSAPLESAEMMTDDAFPIASKMEGAVPGVTAPPPEPIKPGMPAKFRKLGLKTRFGNGFELYTEDEEFTMQIHNLTQIDGRFYDEDQSADVKDSFLFPREWLMFSGRLTKPVEYFFSTAFGFEQVNVLDAFINFHIDDRFQVKVGRFKTPFTYEFYALPIPALINPERSLFFNNFGLNRDVGVMAWGSVFEKRFDYAIGAFNGSRNGFLDTNDMKDLAAYWNFKPFITQEDALFQNLNFGASVNYGDQDGPPVPRLFRTVVPLLGNSVLGVPFLGLAADVRDVGQRELWSTHLAWYHQQLSFIAEWGTGFSNYARSNNRVTRFEVPVDSFYVQAGYFVTGEKVSGRGPIEPICPFDIRKGKRGPGAWEPFFRYNMLNVGRSVFDNNLTDGRPWTNEVQTFGTGVNWYWNPYVKMVFEYEHAIFGDPVYVSNNLTQTSSNLFLVRTQISF